MRFCLMLLSTRTLCSYYLASKRISLILHVVSIGMCVGVWLGICVKWLMYNCWFCMNNFKSISCLGKLNILHILCNRIIKWVNWTSLEHYFFLWLFPYNIKAFTFMMIMHIRRYVILNFLVSNQNLFSRFLRCVDLRRKWNFLMYRWRIKRVNSCLGILILVLILFICEIFLLSKKYWRLLVNFEPLLNFVMC